MSFWNPQGYKGGGPAPAASGTQPGTPPFATWAEQGAPPAASGTGTPPVASGTQPNSPNTDMYSPFRGMSPYDVYAANPNGLPAGWSWDAFMGQNPTSYNSAGGSPDQNYAAWNAAGQPGFDSNGWALDSSGSYANRGGTGFGINLSNARPYPGTPATTPATPPPTTPPPTKPPNPAAPPVSDPEGFKPTGLPSPQDSGYKMYTNPALSQKTGIDQTNPVVAAMMKKFKRGFW